MEMNLSNIILIFLLLIFGLPAASPSLFGREVPNKVWIISIVSGGLFGFVLALYGWPFPKNLVASLLCVPVGALFPIIGWLPKTIFHK